MNEPITITVHGHPAPQGSKRAFAIRKGGVLTGKAAVIESSHDRVKSWRQAVMDAALGAMGEREAMDGPLEVHMTFYLPRPKDHYGTGRNAHVLKPSAPPYPVKPPDCGKLARATEDALSTPVSTCSARSSPLSSYDQGRTASGHRRHPRHPCLPLLRGRDPGPDRHNPRRLRCLHSGPGRTRRDAEDAELEILTGRGFDLVKISIETKEEPLW
jgi:hypothetical protein